MRNYKNLYYVSIKQETPTRFNRSFLEQGRNLNRLFICSYNYNGIFFSSINALLLQINTIQFCEMLGRFYCFKANQQWSLLSTRNPLYWYILKSLYNSWFVIHGIFYYFIFLWFQKRVFHVKILWSSVKKGELLSRADLNREQSLTKLSPGGRLESVCVPSPSHGDMSPSVRTPR